MCRFVFSVISDAVQIESPTTEDSVQVHEILEQYADNQLDSQMQRSLKD